MSNRKAICTTVEAIVDYWAGHVDESGLSVDFSEAQERCWRCGCQRKLQRCHIIPDALGGRDEPSNFVLLCARCHLDNPNVSDPEIMWDWLRAYAVPFYNTFWQIEGEREYERLYHVSFRDELERRRVQDVHELERLIKAAVEKSNYHFGDPHFNIATNAGILRMVLKEYDRMHGC